jgi:outer membrane lipoprotein-sorting protein
MAFLVAGCGGGAASPTATPAAKAPATALPQTAQAAATEAPKPTLAPTIAPTAAPKPTEKPVAASPLQIAPLGDEYSFDQVITLAGQAPQTVKMAVKKGKIRMESSAMGEPVLMIADSGQKVAYVVNEAEKQAMKIPFDQFQGQEQQATRDPAVLTQDLPKGQMVGSEAIDGKACDVYSVSSPYGNAKIWLWKEKGFPLKAEIGNAGQTITVEYQNLKVGGLDDSLFDLPAGIQVIDLGNLQDMMKNLPGAPPAKP